MTTTHRNSKTWLVTGCSSGLGRALAQRVLETGDRCVATARDPATLADLARAHPRTCLALALDVKDGSQRETVVARAEAEWDGVDVLVNNAGHGYSAAVEEGEEELIREMFDTNFFALAAMTRRVLPGMRARGRGHVINISSIGGLVGSPASGYYNASKFAVEGLSQALAKEVAPLGLKVTLVEPGPFRTDFQGRSMKTAGHAVAAYEATAGTRRAQLRQSDGQQPGDPLRAADAIIHVAGCDAPPLHLLLGRAAVARAREKLTDLMQTIDRWESLSVSADFPAS